MRYLQQREELKKSYLFYSAILASNHERFWIFVNI